VQAKIISQESVVADLSEGYPEPWATEAAAKTEDTPAINFPKVIRRSR